MNALPQPNKNPDIQLLERLVGNGNVVTVHTFMIDLTGDHVIAMFLEQLLYWRSRSTDKNHEIAKSDADWYDEIRISERQMRRARAWLLAHKLTKVQRKRSKYYANQPVYHYTVNMEALQKAIIKALGKPGRAPKVTVGELHEPSSSKVDGSQGSQGDELSGSFTETIAETTTETTEKIVASATAVSAKSSKPKREKKPAPIKLRSEGKPFPLYDALERLIWNKPNDDTAARLWTAPIGVIAKWLNGEVHKFREHEIGRISRPAEVRHVEAFVAWYQTTKNGAALPRDVVKFVDYWREWASGGSAIRKQPLSEVEAERTVPLTTPSEGAKPTGDGTLAAKMRAAAEEIARRNQEAQLAAKGQKAS